MFTQETAVNRTQIAANRIVAHHFPSKEYFLAKILNA